MTFDTFMAIVLDEFPSAVVEQATDGELVVYTRMTLDGDRVVELPEED